MLADFFDMLARTHAYTSAWLERAHASIPASCPNEGNCDLEVLVHIYSQTDHHGSNVSVAETLGFRG